jgi:hypothetical protein
MQKVTPIKKSTYQDYLLKQKDRLGSAGVNMEPHQKNIFHPFLIENDKKSYFLPFTIYN